MDSGDVIQIVRNTLYHIDRRLVDHGERVAYILHKMLCAAGGISAKDITQVCWLGLLHDVGAYKTEEIDRMVEFEEASFINHSIYSYLFVRDYSPLTELAQALLFHHFDYCEIPDSCECLEVAAMLRLADRIDCLVAAGETGKVIPFDFAQLAGWRFGKEVTELFFRAERQYGILDALRTGRFKEDVDLLFQSTVLTEQQRRNYLRMLIYTIDFRSKFTVTHTVTTVGVSFELAQRMLPEALRSRVYYGALLHDLGKIAIPLSILEKPGALTEEETRVMRTHVLLTREILQGYIDTDILEIAARHHEKLDGSGYPQQLRAEQLTTGQRIVAVADIVSALRGRRSYKEPMPAAEVTAIVDAMARRGQLCPDVVRVLLGQYDQIIEAADERCETALQGYEQMQTEYAGLMEQYKHAGRAKAEHC